MGDAYVATTVDPAELARLAKAHAFALGFDLVGITELGPVQSAPIFDEWVAAGRAGTMHYLARGAEKRRDSRLPKPGDDARHRRRRSTTAGASRAGPWRATRAARTTTT